MYNQKIVSPIESEETKAVSLVKCLKIEMESDPEVAAKDIFSRLVSIKALELSSIYR